MLSIQIASLPFLLCSFIILALGLFSLTKGLTLKTRQLFFCFCLMLAGWFFFKTIQMHSSNAIWPQLIFACIALTGLFCFYLYHQIIHYTIKPSIHFVFLNSCLALISANVIVNLLSAQKYASLWTHAGLIIFWVSIMGYSFVKIFKKIQSGKRQISRLDSNRNYYLLLSNGILSVGFFFYFLPFYPAEAICILCSAFIIYHSTLHLQAMPDITVLARRVFCFFAGSFFVLFLGAVGTLIYIAKIPSVFILKLAEVSVLFFLSGLTLAHFFTNWMNIVKQYCLPRYYCKKQQFDQLTQQIIQSTNKATLNDHLRQVFTSIFDCAGASFFLWDFEKSAYVLQSQCGVRQSAVMQMESNYILPKFLARKNYILINDNLYLNSDLLSQENQDLLYVFHQNHINLCVPIISRNIHTSSDPSHTTLPQENERDKYLIGFFIFAEKNSHLPYNLEEVRQIKYLAQCLDIALQSIELDQLQTAPQNLNVQTDHPKLRNYFPSSIADEVLSHMQNAQRWNGQKHHAVILMFDLRGFTSMFEDNKAEEVVEWLNEYFKEMIETITAFGGTIDKFMGDGGLVVFGVSRALINPEQDAVACALDMQKSLKNLNNKRKQKGLNLLHMGIAITAGDVMAGNIGSEKHMEFTVIGDPVNLAARLQALAKSGQIIATENIKEKIQAHVTFKECPAMEIRGKSEKVKVIEIEKQNGPDYPPKTHQAMGY